MLATLTLVAQWADMEDGGPSATARHVAAHRLGFTRVATDYGDPAADEALAADVVGGLVVPASRMRDYLAARTAFFDRCVTGAIDRGVRQVVTGAAGYDGRALRYARPGVRWFEVDHPATQRDKLGRLKRLGIAASGVRFVEADFTRDPVADRLRAAGLDPDEPSLFLLEGVAVYLEAAVLENVLDQFRQVAAPGSQLAISVSVSRPAGDTVPGPASRPRSPRWGSRSGPRSRPARPRPCWPGPAGRSRTAEQGGGEAPARRERLRSAGLLTATAGPRTACRPARPVRPAGQPSQPPQAGATAAVGPALPGARRVHDRVRQRGRAQPAAPHHRPRARPVRRRRLAGVDGHVGELHAVRHRGAPHRRRAHASARAPRPTWTACDAGATSPSTGPPGRSTRATRARTPSCAPPRPACGRGRSGRRCRPSSSSAGGTASAPDQVGRLRDSLVPLVRRLDPGLPDCLPILPRACSARSPPCRPGRTRPTRPACRSRRCWPGSCCRSRSSTRARRGSPWRPPPPCCACWARTGRGCGISRPRRVSPRRPSAGRSAS